MNLEQKKLVELSQEFKKRRLQLELTQTQLSKISGVSQSLITKLESQKIDPTFTSLLKIEQALEELEEINLKEAQDIMEVKLVVLSQKESISKALEVMLEKDLSQVLVKNMLGDIIGVLHERTLVKAISKKEDIYKKTIKEFISPLPIIVPKDYNVEDLSFIFQNKKTSCVLVGSQKKIVGIITKVDLFKR